MTDHPFNPNVVALKQLIAASIAKDPHELDCFLWCKMCHSDRAAAIGVSEKTVQRMIGREPGNPPFVHTTRHVEGVKTTLLRVGEPGPKTSYDHARMMRTVWRNWLEKVIPARGLELNAEKAKLEALALETNDPSVQKEALDKLAKVGELLGKLRGVMETRHEFGCFVGLAEAWPEGMQVEIFAMILDNLPEFMTGVKHVQAMERAQGKSVRSLFFDYPHIATIRKYHAIALEMTIAKYQASKKEPPAALKALNPALWKHLKPKPEPK
jgi:hypothetical protein